MSQTEKNQSILHFRTLQLIHHHTVSLMEVIIPPLLVVGEVLIGSLIFSIIKFHDKIEFYLEIGLMGICSMVVLALNLVLHSGNAVYTAHVRYSASILEQRNMLSRLDWCYYRAFPARPIRIPNLLTLTKRTFVTLAQTVFYNVISLLVAFP